ncbi:MAG: hypothetical protein KDD53_11985, partial [Bdellovibrionales bacterium]|nr:hypothetical protein [Bdellovibrionales bacterium]
KDQNSPNSPSDSSSHDNPVDVSEGPSVNQLPNPNDYKSASQELSEIYPMNSEGDNMPSIVVWDISENDPQSEPGREAETSTDPQIKGETNTSVIDSPNKGSGKL